jgi:hypothetical protein
MLLDIIEVKPLKGHRLHIRFEDGVAGDVDVTRLIRLDGVFAPLKQTKRFAEVFLDPELGTVCWPNGADLDPVVLYSAITGSGLPRSAHSSSSVHDELWFAIKHKRLIRFQYQGYQRTAEPHDYGVQKSITTLLVYQLRGGSKTKSMGWKHIKVSEIRQLQVLSESFPGGRSVPSGKHKKWDQLFIRVSPAA